VEQKNGGGRLCGCRCLVEEGGGADRGGLVESDAYSLSTPPLLQDTTQAWQGTFCCLGCVLAFLFGKEGEEGGWRRLPSPPPASPPQNVLAPPRGARGQRRRRIVLRGRVHFDVRPVVSTQASSFLV